MRKARPKGCPGAWFSAALIASNAQSYAALKSLHGQDAMLVWFKIEAVENSSEITTQRPTASGRFQDEPIRAHVVKPSSLMASAQ
jgi:hypothetical protein